MYKMTITIENPIAGIRKELRRQFNENTFTVTKWTNGFPTVDAAIEEVKAQSAEPDKEPPTW